MGVRNKLVIGGVFYWWFVFIIRNLVRRIKKIYMEKGIIK